MLCPECDIPGIGALDYRLDRKCGRVIVQGMEMSVGLGDFCRDWIQDLDYLRCDLNTHSLNE